jgi:hypothetical protein
MRVGLVCFVVVIILPIQPCFAQVNTKHSTYPATNGNHDFGNNRYQYPDRNSPTSNENPPRANHSRHARSTNAYLYSSDYCYWNYINPDELDSDHGRQNRPPGNGVSHSIAKACFCPVPAAQNHCHDAWLCGWNIICVDSQHFSAAGSCKNQMYRRYRTISDCQKLLKRFWRHTDCFVVLIVFS